jgi:hypothetical protein
VRRPRRLRRALARRAPMPWTIRVLVFLFRLWAHAFACALWLVGWVFFTD